MGLRGRNRVNPKRERRRQALRKLSDPQEYTIRVIWTTPTQAALWEQAKILCAKLDMPLSIDALRFQDPDVAG